jgi:hypothetical protein
MSPWVPVQISRLEPSRIEAIEDWPWLDQHVLRSSRSRQVCITCPFLRRHPGPHGIPLLTIGAGRLSWRERWEPLQGAAVAQGGLAQQLEVTVGGVPPPDQPVPRLKRRLELSRKDALKLWAEKRQQGGHRDPGVCRMA